MKNKQSYRTLNINNLIIWILLIYCVVSSTYANKMLDFGSSWKIFIKSYLYEIIYQIF